VDVHFAALGALEVRADDGCEVVLPRRQREVLARLLAAPNRIVAADQLLDELWDDPWSSGARSSLQAQVSRLRAALGGREAIDGDRRGYRVTVTASAQLDVWRFEHLLGEGRRALQDGDPATARTHLEAALALWRGEPFADVDVPGVAAERARLDELRVIAEHDRAAAAIAAGDPADALAGLAPVLERRPWDERAWSLHVTALHACGRQADALRAYERCRRALADELGLEPGGELREVADRVLAQDPTLGAPTVPPDAPTRLLPAPDPLRGDGLPPVRYASNDGLELAHRTVGDGPIDVAWVPDFLSHLDVMWEHPAPAHFLRGLAGLGRLVTYDKRGQGLSARVPGHASADDRARDLLAVLDAVGSERAVLVGSSEGAEIATHAAVLAPARIAGLVIFGSGPVSEPGDGDGEWSLPMDQYVEWMDWAAERWGTGRTLEAIAPSVAGDAEATAWYGRVERQTATPTAIATYARENARTDYRSLLPHIRVPTLVLHRRDDPVPVAAGRYLGANIPGARYVELDGEDHLIWFGDVDAVLAEIAAFVAELA